MQVLGGRREDALAHGLSGRSLRVKTSYGLSWMMKKMRKNSIPINTRAAINCCICSKVLLFCRVCLVCTLGQSQDWLYFFLAYVAVLFCGWNNCHVENGGTLYPFSGLQWRHVPQWEGERSARYVTPPRGYDKERAREAWREQWMEWTKKME